MRTDHTTPQRAINTPELGPKARAVTVAGKAVEAASRRRIRLPSARSRYALWVRTFCSELGKAGVDSIEQRVKAEFEDLVARERHPALEEASKTRVRCAEHFLDVAADLLA